MEKAPCVTWQEGAARGTKLKWHELSSGMMVGLVGVAQPDAA